MAVARVTELISASKKSFEDAVQVGVSRAVKTVFPTVPPRVDYELTKLGRTLLGPINDIAMWARANRAEIADARTVYDKTAAQSPKPATTTQTPSA